MGWSLTWNMRWNEEALVLLQQTKTFAVFPKPMILGILRVVRVHIASCDRWGKHRGSFTTASSFILYVKLPGAVDMMVSLREASSTGLRKYQVPPGTGSRLIHDVGGQCCWLLGPLNTMVEGKVVLARLALFSSTMGQPGSKPGRIAPKKLTSFCWTP